MSSSTENKDKSPIVDSDELEAQENKKYAPHDDSDTPEIIEEKKEIPAEPEIESDADDVEFVETPAEKKQDDTVFWNVCLSIIALCVVIAGVLVYHRVQALPNPIKESKDAITLLEQELASKEQELAQIQSNLKPKQEFENLLSEYKKVQVEIFDAKQAIETEKKKLSTIKQETKDYFNQYVSSVRRSARGRGLEVLRTVKSNKTYLNVEISRVEPHSVKIIHEGGSTTVPASDLPESLRLELGYGDPLNIKAMDQENTGKK